MSMRGYIPALVVLLVTLDAAAAAKCLRTPAIADALSLADHLSTDPWADANLSCIDAALRARLGTPSERAQLRLKSATWLETTGRYAQARAWLRAADAQSDAQAADHDRVTTAAELGWVQYRLGDFDGAERALDGADDAGAILSGLEHAAVLDHLGVVQRERGRYSQADQSFERALKLAGSNTDQATQRLQAQIYNDRGGLRTYRSEFRSAMDDFQHALELYRVLDLGHTLEAARALNNLGNVHRELGDTERARTELAQALDLKIELLGPRNPSTASTVNNLGMVAEQAHDYVGAKAYYARALELYEQALGGDHANVASVATQYGRLQFTTGNYRAALKLLERALAIRDRQFGQYSNWAAETLVDLVPVYGRVGQWGQARRGAERAVAIAVASREQELLYDGYMSYARALAAKDQPSAAIFFGKRAINVIQQMRERDVLPTKREQRSFLAQREHMYRDLADWLITVGRLPEAEQVLDLLKSEELADFAALTAESGESLAGRVGMVRREVSAAARLDEAIHELVKTGDDDVHADAYVRFVAHLHELLAVLRDSKSVAQTQSEDVDTAPQAAPHVAVIRYLVLPERVRILVRTRARFVEHSVEIDRAALNRQVLELRRRLQLRADAASVSEALFNLLIAPVVSELPSGEIQRLSLVPDDILRYVPFAALRDAHGYLIESYALSIATPAAVPDPSSSIRPLRTAAAFGVSRTPDGQVLLPNVPVELRRVVRSSPEDRSGALPGVILLDGAFTRAGAMSALAKGYPVVHIASHFVFRPGSLADSYLLLGDGSHLTLQVIKSDALPLHGVEMLTLSACDTALGDPQADGREIESFAALAQRQGVRSVLAALWSVPDLSTSVIMSKFYRVLANGQDSVDTRAEALRAAQLLLLRGPAADGARTEGPRANSPYADPFFWAAFMLLGSQT